MTVVTPAGRTPERRLRVLISAFSCIPGLGSEPGTGWLWAVAAAVHHDVWLLTWDGYRVHVDDALDQRQDLRIRPVYLPQPRWMPGGPEDLRALRLRYLVWQGAAHGRAKQLHAEVGFDVVHHLTLAADWMPPGVGGVDDVPLVWGPVGGYSRPAWSMARWLGGRWVLDEVTRRLTTGTLRAIGGRWAARRAAVTIAQNRDAADRLERLGARLVVVEPNVALEAPRSDGRDPGVASQASSAPATRRGRAVYAGRLIRWKGLPIALRALADPRLAAWTLDVYGEGDDRDRLERLAQRLRLGTRLRFHGMRGREEVQRAFAEADVLVLPSVNDSAGWVIAEAAAQGCPTVCLDRGGPPDLVALGVGRAVEAGGELPGRFASAILQSRRLPGPIDAWRWDRLPDRLDEWYQLAVERRPSSPRAVTAAYTSSNWSRDTSGENSDS